MKYIVAAMHRIAQDWAARQGLKQAEFKTVTQAFSLRGLPANTEIHVVDSTVKFQDSAKLNRTLESHFTNVHRHRL